MVPRTPQRRIQTWTSRPSERWFLFLLHMVCCLFSSCQILMSVRLEPTTVTPMPPAPTQLGASNAAVLQAGSETGSNAQVRYYHCILCNMYFCGCCQWHHHRQLDLSTSSSSQIWTSVPTGPTCVATTLTVWTPWVRTAACAKKGSLETGSSVQVTHHKPPSCRSLPVKNALLQPVWSIVQIATSVRTTVTCVRTATASTCPEGSAVSVTWASSPPLMERPVKVRPPPPGAETDNCRKIIHTHTHIHRDGKLIWDFSLQLTMLFIAVIYFNQFTVLYYTLWCFTIILIYYAFTYIPARTPIKNPLPREILQEWIFTVVRFVTTACISCVLDEVEWCSWRHGDNGSQFFINSRVKKSRFKQGFFNLTSQCENVKTWSNHPLIAHSCSFLSFFLLPPPPPPLLFFFSLLQTLMSVPSLTSVSMDAASTYQDSSDVNVRPVMSWTEVEATARVRLMF